MDYRISVLLPVYNAEKYIAETIRSILDQSYSNFELLIADDASIDRTIEVIQTLADSRIRCFHNSKNMGKTGTVAKLFKYATGGLVTIHDADDMSFPERFARQVNTFKNDPTIAMCGTSFMSVSEDGSKILETIHMKTDYLEILASIDNCSQFHGPTMIIKKSVLDELGEIYRPYFKNNYEDTDLAYRIIEKHPAYNLPDVLYKYRILTNSLCRRNVNVRTRNLYKVVAFLAKERATKGVDSIAAGTPELADAFLNDVTLHYTVDTSLIHREAASYFMYWQLYTRAIEESWLAVRRNPFQLINYRTLQYCVRNSMLYSFKKRLADSKS
jgi:glycosyltransferase involved in cell wall biosynthesis